MNEQPTRTPLRLPKRRKVLSPYGMAVLMACAIFVCEIGVMYVLNLMPPLSHEFEAIIDSTILLTFLTPFYLLLYRPFWEEHKRFEEEIQYLSRKLIDSGEEERKRVSHDLHDQCGQTLTAIQFRLDALRKSLPPPHTQQTEDVLAIVGLTTQLGNELREVVYRMRPSMLDEIGLVSALRSLVAEFSEQLPDIDFNEEHAFDKQQMIIASDVEIALYRTCQESLNNVVKYARASEVSVILESQKGKIVLRVQDDGVGFDISKLTVAASRLKGVGLLGMRERVAALNGEFEIISSPGRGTTVTVVLPARKD